SRGIGRAGRGITIRCGSVARRTRRPHCAMLDREPPREAAPVPTTEPFTSDQIREIGRATATASNETGLHFSAYIGDVDGDVRDGAEKLHAALGADAPRAVL